MKLISPLPYGMGLTLTFISAMTLSAAAQPTWQDAPAPINTMLDTPWLPGVQISTSRQWLVRLERPTLPPVADLAQERVPLAGLQLDPLRRGRALEYAFRGLTLQELATGDLRPVALPDNAEIRHIDWSPEGNLLAFTLTDGSGPMALWVLDTATAEARPLTEPRLNATYGQPCHWISEAEGLLCKLLPPDQPAPPAPPMVPPGPRIEENRGRQAPARTYTNLLQTPHDEALFTYYLSSVVAQVSLDGQQRPLTESALVQSARPSPDGQWFVFTTFQEPFSYQVPASRFPRQVAVRSLAAAAPEVFRVADLPLADAVPITFDSVRTGRRLVNWRPDQPATLYWVEALDGGDAGQPADQRDGVYQLAAPFTAEPQVLWTTELRFDRIYWGTANLALGQEYWYDSRRLRTWRLDPANPAVAPVLLNDRDWQDSYANPGQPLTAPGPYHRSTLVLADGDSAFLRGRGASPQGVYPFLDRWDLTDNTTERLWQSADPYYDQVVATLDTTTDGITEVLTYRQSATEPPNYWRLSLETQQVTPLTDFADPLPWFAEVSREVVRYPRADGVMLSATVYLPPGHDPATDGPLPTLLWAYPEEFKSRDAAAQVTTAENAFSRPYAYSPLFLLTQGYALMLGPTMPVIGEGDQEPNDTYIQQLTASAEAAVDYLVDAGITTPDQVAIGGHSYGAFTAANLLAHTDLFQAGIANSGAYNRTLTPFGFQGEQRTFWQAPDTYMAMSPFAQAASINEPLLMIHGAEDENSGTYPIQSERLYAALQGLGGQVRWVELPAEGHGYRSREGVGHALWEMTRWLDIHLQGEDPDQYPTAD